MVAATVAVSMVRTAGLVRSEPAVSRCPVAATNKGKRGQVDAPPQPVGEAAAGQRGGLDRDQQVDGDHAPGDRPGPPGGREGHQQVQQVELDVAVQQQRREVDAGEGQGQPAEVAVQVQGPSGCGPAAEQAGGDGQAQMVEAASRP